MKRIKYGTQKISEADIEAVVGVLKNSNLTQGQEIPSFEEEIDLRLGHDVHSVVLNSATSALHVGYLSLGLGFGDLVWTSANTFVATASAARMCGADIDFVDIDEQSLNMDMRCLAAKLEHCVQQGDSLPDIVVPVHFGGLPCEMTVLRELSEKFGFKVLEDASHAMGARYDGASLVGSCDFSEGAVFSFHAIKMITTGEGGCFVSRNSRVAAAAKLFRSHGICSDIGNMRRRPESELWNYQQLHLGYNYRMTDFQAALGRSQLARLDQFVATRRRIAERYHRELKGLPIFFQTESPSLISSYHLFVIRVDRSLRLSLYDYLWENGIEVNFHYIPVYRQPYYEDLGFVVGYCPVAERYFNEGISLPIHADLSRNDQSIVIAAIKNFFRTHQEATF